jgi:hypothetical protein
VLLVKISLFQVKIKDKVVMDHQALPIMELMEVMEAIQNKLQET